MSQTISPSFNANRNTISFSPQGLNEFAEEKVLDTFDFYQTRYSMYSWMTLNEFRKYTLKWIESNPFVWQKYKSCKWNALGGISWGEKSIEPCPAMLNVQQCNDALLKSCFKEFLKWDGNGPVRMDGRLLEKFNRVVTRSAAQGARMTLTVGQMYDVDTVEFKEGVSSNIEGLFKGTMNTCKGWIELMKESAKKAGFEHLNQENLISEDDWDGRDFTGSIFELADSLELQPELDSIMTEGGAMGTDEDGNEVMYTPFFFCDPRIYKSLKTQINAQNEDLIANKKRRLDVTEVPHLNGSINVYKLDGTPIIPINDLSKAEKYTKGHTGLFGLTVSGNIALGGSFSAIPAIYRNEGSEVGIRVQYHDDNDKNYWSWLSHALFSAQINDTDLMAATQGYFIPA